MRFYALDPLREVRHLDRFAYAESGAPEQKESRCITHVSNTDASGATKEADIYHDRDITDSDLDAVFSAVMVTQ